MSNAPLSKKYFLNPGYVCVPLESMFLAAVVASGVAVTVFDQRLKRGGMGVYTHPLRSMGQSTAVFAAPSIASLVKLFTDSGSSKGDLEANLYGGAVNGDSLYYIPGQSEKNVSIGCEVLEKLGVKVAGRDIGGQHARKIIFNSATGEAVIAKVVNVRKTDWYPPANPRLRRERERNR